MSKNEDTDNPFATHAHAQRAGDLAVLFVRGGRSACADCVPIVSRQHEIEGVYALWETRVWSPPMARASCCGLMPDDRGLSVCVRSSMYMAMRTLVGESAGEGLADGHGWGEYMGWGIRDL